MKALYSERNLSKYKISEKVQSAELF
jgi:hypothetical protein